MSKLEGFTGNRVVIFTVMEAAFDALVSQWQALATSLTDVECEDLVMEGASVFAGATSGLDPDDIGNAAIALQEFSAKCEREAAKAEAERPISDAIARSLTLR